MSFAGFGTSPFGSAPFGGGVGLLPARDITVTFGTDQARTLNTTQPTARSLNTTPPTARTLTTQLTRDVVVNMPRIARQYVKFRVTATDTDGAAVTITGVDVALLTPQTTPTADTEWAAATWATPVASILAGGPDTDGSFDEYVIPAEGVDLWARVVDAPEISAALVGRLSVI